jgi:hypothetical protein
MGILRGILWVAEVAVSIALHSRKPSSPRVPKIVNVDQKVKDGRVVERMFKDCSDLGYWDAQTGEFLGSRGGGTRRGYVTRKEEFKKNKYFRG